MSETELKFQVPAGVHDALEAELLRRGATRVRMEAIYHDTPERGLAESKLALRLRHEGADWVQTLKASRDSSVRRSEHSVALLPPKDGAQPVLDVTRHDGSDAYAELCKVLDGQGRPGALVEIFRTRVQRLHCEIDVVGSVIEAAFDTGAVVTGDRSSPISELELELKSGDPAALIELGKTWSAHAGLWLSSVSKAERGGRLLRGEPFGAPVKATRVPLRRRLPAHAALQVIARSCIEQVLANASDVADGCTGEEHIHQLRVGLRRLRTALRELGALGPGFDGRFDAPLAEAFRRLGAARDEVAVARCARRLLEAAGAPVVAWSDHDQEVDPAQVVRATEFQAVLLDLIGFTLEDSPAAADPSRVLRRHVVARLKRLHRQVTRDGRRFERLDEGARHRVRKRLKRLRYLSEFVASLFDGHAVRRSLASLEPAQDALGEHVDTVVAIARFRREAQRNAEAVWSVGWLEAHLEVTARSCAKALRRIARTPQFWRR